MKASTAKIVIGVSLALSAVVVFGRSQKTWNRSMAPAQPRYPNGQVQPQYPNEQWQPQYPNGQWQPQYQGGQAQHWYPNEQAQPRHQHVQAQVPAPSQYQSPKKPKKAIFVGELNASGEAKEVAVNRVISQCYLEIVSGTVSINTVVVRPEKLALPQTTRLTPGQLHVIDLGGSRSVTGFRISDNGRGVYRVFVK